METHEGLSRLRVIELGGRVSAPYAGKMLADLGAQVIKVEPPGGDPSRHYGPFPSDRKADPEASGTFLYLNANKDSVVIDLLEAGGQARLAELAAGADLIIHNFSPSEMAARGMTYSGLSEKNPVKANPALVMLSITPFGQTGPYKDFQGDDLVAMHSGGWGWICPGRYGLMEEPPIKPYGKHAAVQVAMLGVTIALSACMGARQTGRGDHIDFSSQEAVAFLLGRHFAN